MISRETDPLERENIEAIVEELFCLYDEQYADYRNAPVKSKGREVWLIEMAMDALTELLEREVL